MLGVIALGTIKSHQVASDIKPWRQKLPLALTTNPVAVAITPWDVLPCGVLAAAHVIACFWLFCFPEKSRFKQQDVIFRVKDVWVENK